MKNLNVLAAFGLGIAATLLVSAALPAQEEGHAAEASAAMDGGMMMAAMAPGEMHRRLAPLEGEWALKTKWRMGPDSPWEDAEATAHREWIFGGRYLIEKVKGETPMGPFEGMSIMGYDNLREEYVTIWIDNWSTGFHIARGEAGENPKVMESEGHISNPMTGEKEQWFRDRMEIVSGEKNVFQTFHKGPDGDEYMAMEIVGKRK